MAFKKRKKSYSRKSKKVSSSKKTYKRSKGKSNTASLVGTIVGGGLYGMGRAYISTMIKPFTDKLGFAGDYADNVAMGGISYLMAKRKIPFIKDLKFSADIGKAGLTIESAFAGVDLKNQLMGSNNSITSSVDNRF